MSSDLDGSIIKFAELKAKLEELENELANKLFIKDNIRNELILRDKTNQLDMNDSLVKEWSSTYASYLNSVSFNDQIDSFRQELKWAPIYDDDKFFYVIEKSLLFLDKNELRKILDLSGLGLERWLSKKNAPHPVMRRNIFNIIIKQLESIQ